MYNMIFKVNPYSKVIIEQVLNKSLENFGRFRDVFITDNHILVYTRCGGGNRAEYKYVFDEMANHGLYSHDEDCKYDSTYANIFFNIPKEYKEKLQPLVTAELPADLWKRYMEQLKSN